MAKFGDGESFFSYSEVGEFYTGVIMALGSLFIYLRDGRIENSQLGYWA
jgi:hypothetical protein